MRAPLAVLILAGAASVATAQQRTEDFRWEKSLDRDKVVSLHNLNGNITVTTSTTGKVEIVGRHRGRGDPREVTIEVYEWSGGITACSVFRRLETECNEDGMTNRSRDRRDRDGWRDRDWDDIQIDMEVRVPRGLRVHAGAVSGNVRITGAEGVVRGSSVSGDVRMEGLRATSVRASSVSGNITVAIEQLTGEGSLMFSSVSGDVVAELPKDINADVSMRSVSGNLDSDFPLTLNGRVRRSSIEARIGKGGRELDVHTVSGDVRLRQRP